MVTNMIEQLLDQGELAKAEQAFTAVFQSADPFDGPLRPTIESRIILYPTAGFTLYEDQYNALAQAAMAIGESEAILSFTWGYTGHDFEKRKHWKIEFGSYESYRSMSDRIFMMVENTIYSTKGTWGVIISQERHAVIGGPRRFMDVLSAKLPDIDNQGKDFLATWKDRRNRLHSKIDWLPGLLTHVYGPDKAKELLAEVGLRDHERLIS
jgi:hypothetical protein